MKPNGHRGGSSGNARLLSRGFLWVGGRAHWLGPLHRTLTWLPTCRELGWGGRAPCPLTPLALGTVQFLSAVGPWLQSLADCWPETAPWPQCVVLPVRLPPSAKERTTQEDGATVEHKVTVCTDPSTPVTLTVTGPTHTSGEGATQRPGCEDLVLVCHALGESYHPVV